MKIAFFEIEGWEKKSFEKAFPKDELLFYSFPLNEDSIPSEIKDVELISIFICSDITKKVLENFSNLKLIITRSTGFNHIDLLAAKEKNIIVCNVPYYAKTAVAEYTFGVMLALMRKICQAEYEMPHVEVPESVSLRGMQLAGKNLGIIGLGSIGNAVAQIARGFSMNVLVCDESLQKKQTQKDFTLVSFEEILHQSDILTLHVPLTEQTHHLINKDAIKKMKKGLFLINTARGEVVESQALLYGFEKEILAGVALDVVEEEGLTKDPIPLLENPTASVSTLKTVLTNRFLMHHPRVLITPHNAYNTHEALQECLNNTIEIIQKWQKGKPICVIPVTSS